MIKTTLVHCVVLMCLLAGSQAYGQHPREQKLLKQLRTASSGPRKVAVLNDLSVEYTNAGNAEEGEKYGKEALALAKKINDGHGIAASCTNLGHSYIYRDNTRAMAMFRAALARNKKLGDEESVADAYVNIGNVYYDMADFGNSLKCYSYAISFAKSTNAVDLEGDASVNSGISYYALGDYPSALKMHYRALKLYDQLKDRRKKADVLNCLGNVYADQRNNPMALHMYFSSLALCKQLKDQLGTGNALINIGLIYTDQRKYEAAAFMINKSLTMFAELGDRPGMALCYNSLGALLCEKKAYREALQMCELSLKISTAAGDIIEASDAHLVMVRVYIRLGKLEQARQLLTATLDATKGIGHKLQVRDAYRIFVTLDSLSNDYEAAFAHQKLWGLYSDSLNNEQAARKGYQAALQYDFDKKALEEKRKHDGAIHSLETRNRLGSQRQQFLTLMLVLFVLAMLVIWFFVRRASSANKKYYAVISNENVQKETLLQEVHHRVNNSLQMISALLAMQADTSNNDEIRAYLLKSESRIQAMSVMHKLLHLGNSKLEVNIKDYLGDVLRFYDDLLESQPGVRLNVTVPSESFHTKAAMPLGLVLNELITNSLKYAFAENKGTIDVLLEKDQHGSWLFRVSDNGSGFSGNEKPNDQSSIGLRLVRLMSLQLNGTLSVSGMQGTTVSITFPDKIRL
jgi:two-component system, sensor histidine kinase PdtaS